MRLRLLDLPITCRLSPTQPRAPEMGRVADFGAPVTPSAVVELGQIGGGEHEVARGEILLEVGE